MNQRPTLSVISLALLALSVSGCASFTPDGGFDTVRSMTRERIGQSPTLLRTDADNATAADMIRALLEKPLSADDAVNIALLNNRGLQADYAELGIAEADLVQAGRLPNPTFTFGRLKRGNDIEIERKLMLPVMSLLTMPITSRLEKRRFEQAQLRAVAETLRLADDTRRTYFAAIAAQESATYAEQVKSSAEAGAELAEKMAKVGNWSKLRQAREQSFYADATAQLARARQAQLANREKLTRLMGLSGNQIVFTLPERLPDLPKSPRDIADAEVLAMQNRVDVMMAKRELAGLADSLGLAKTTRFINVLDVSYLRNGFNDGGPPQNGYEIELQIPLFDWGSARVARAETQYMQAVNRAAGQAITARSEVRDAYAGYRSAYDIARHYRDEVVPLKKRISDEQMLRYNGMLISVFDLLADSRAQAMSVNASIEALRDFWMADSALQIALTGTSANAGASASSSDMSGPAESAAH